MPLPILYIAAICKLGKGNNFLGISTGGMQNEKIQNLLTLSEYRSR